MRRALLRTAGLALAALLLAVRVAAAEGLLNARLGAVAVQGYDVVAYFTEGEPTPGDPALEHVWRGVRWRFASAENRAAFAAEPTRYAPRYGGFCAGGVALGRTSPIDPEAFVIVDGRLYLNFDKPTAVELAADAEETIRRADENWRRLNDPD